MMSQSMPMAKAALACSSTPWSTAVRRVSGSGSGGQVVWLSYIFGLSACSVCVWPMICCPPTTPCEIEQESNPWNLSQSSTFCKMERQEKLMRTEGVTYFTVWAAIPSAEDPTTRGPESQNTRHHALTLRDEN